MLFRSGEIGVKKYEKEIPACLSGEVAGTFPSHLAPKTDEDNGLSHPEIVKHTLSKPCIATLKLDGSSCTIVVIDGKIAHVCSRNLSLKESDRNGFWIVAKKLAISGISNCVIQGELMGPGVQGNQLKLTEPTLFVYQIRDLNEGRWLNYIEMAGACDQLLKCNWVPIVTTALEHTVEWIQDVADSVKLPDGKPAEGIVVRPIDMEVMGIGRPLGFKIINRNYKDQ